MDMCAAHTKKDVGTECTQDGWTDRKTDTPLLESALVCPAKVSETDMKQTRDQCASDQCCEAAGCLATAQGGDGDKGEMGNAWERQRAGCVECEAGVFFLRGSGF